MSETKFTSGPWRVAADSFGGFNRIWSADSDDVATCQGDGAIPREQRQANEFLISAAPELYEALWGLREAFRGQDICDCQGSPDCPITMAEKALAKARGEAS